MLPHVHVCVCVCECMHLSLLAAHVHTAVDARKCPIPCGFTDGCQRNSVLIVVHTCPLRGNDSSPLLSVPFDVSFRYFPHLCPQSFPMIFSSPSGAGELFWLSLQPQHPPQAALLSGHDKKNNHVYSSPY